MYTIMLVEDERWVRTAFKRTVERTGLPFTVIHESSNGLDALDWLKDNQVDLIMADIRMPVMDGLTFIDQLHEGGQRQSVIIVSGHDDFSYVQRCLRAGVFDYLLKPVEVEEMKNCLMKWMKEKDSSLEPNEGLKPEDKIGMSAIEKVIELIKVSQPKNISLTEAAAAVKLNPSYLSQLFKQRMNQTFLDFSLRLRMDEAEWLLVHTSLRVWEIAQRLGYTDLSYFGNTFKKIKGKTPLEFRKSFQLIEEGTGRTR
ncbi:response regulator transcription factor [Paenibacillus aceris]|uniref:YesN/AraC family two-component response regulator n=1 Tax=Paenibacillus aceris TaxID=869555 RepID=A0ABS4HXA0_9BACL|nr:response regulator [Paenibacillus aceris]MBP1963252.1 YesN/AraC family two-component response regulator [Paenibacillus aceris]NHW38635.1 response regulator [Paenibacillus aceris]